MNLSSALPGCCAAKRREAPCFEILGCCRDATHSKPCDSRLYLVPLLG